MKKWIIAIIMLLIGLSSFIFANYYLEDNNESKSISEVTEKDISGAVDEEEYILTAEDCYEDEYFDAEDQWCYANEATDESEDFSGDYEGSSFENHGENEDGLKNQEAIYKIDGDSITLLSGEEDETHREIWSLYTKAIPSYFRENVKYFNVTNEPENDVDASVFRDRENFLEWHIHVNKVSYFDEETGELNKDKVHTLIHEFTHIMTLGDDQINEVNPSFDDQEIAEFKNSCNTYYLDEGCLEKGSYLERFMTQFWSQADIDFALESGGAETFNQEGTESLYTLRDTDFVTEYAATSSTEDIAESFGFFILKPKPTGNTIVDQKMLFFYGYPDLVKLRDIIRNRLK